MSGRAWQPGAGGLAGLPGGLDRVERTLAEADRLSAWPAMPVGTAGVDVAGVAADLARLELPAGSAVLIAMPNGTDLLRLFFAALMTGAVPMLVPPSTPSVRLRELAGRVGAAAVVAPRPEPGRYGVAAAHPVGRAGLVRLAGGRPAYSPGQVIVTTSGTSGVFSGCLHRLDSLLRNAERHGTATGLRPDDTVLVTLPMYYSYALVAQALGALVRGCRLAVSGPPFTLPAYREAVRAAGATVSSLTPSLVRVLLAGGGALPWPLRALTVGGDRTPADQVAALLAGNPDRELYLTYGLTEAGPRVATLAAHREPPHLHASVGLPLPGVRVSIREPDPAGAGELLVHTDTAFIRRVGRVDGAGGSAWLARGVVATGDRFTRDADGYLYHQGRLSDFVVLNGEKVSLASVRRLANSVPGVLRAATRTRQDDDGRTGYELELYLDRPEQADQIRRVVTGLLLRAERPDRIRVRAAEDAALHK